MQTPGPVGENDDEGYDDIRNYDDGDQDDDDDDDDFLDDDDLDDDDHDDKDDTCKSVQGDEAALTSRLESKSGWGI